MLFVVKIFKTDKRTKKGERLFGEYEYDRKDKESVERDIKDIWRELFGSGGYRYEIHEMYVTKTYLLSGEEYQERYDTPNCCSPSSETYWSM